MEKGNWSDLPPELLAVIAESLGIIELLSFRNVCKDWNSASATASAQIESSKEPWFLVYGEGPTCECLLVSNSGKKHSINTPELMGSSTTCLASTHGWLLLFQNGGSIFFLCPFSRAKIHLPKLPFSEITDHVATFSSPPTSENCVVAVISRSSETEELEVNMLQRGADAWTIHRTVRPQLLGALKGATFHGGAFQFFDIIDKVAVFCVEKQSWEFFRIVFAPKEMSLADTVDLKCLSRNRMKKFLSKGMDERVGLSKDVSISTCATQISCDNIDEVVFCETFYAAQTQNSETRHLKGVWTNQDFSKSLQIRAGDGDDR